MTEDEKRQREEESYEMEKKIEETLSKLPNKSVDMLELASKIGVQGMKVHESAERLKKGEDSTIDFSFYNPDLKNLRWLGKGSDLVPENPTASILDAFDNPYPARMYTVEFVSEEFTSICPRTQQPDFATFKISYIPGPKCVETKSLKLYLQSYRYVQGFMERITNKVLDDFCLVIGPRVVEIVAEYNKRGGIGTTIRVGFRKPDEEIKEDIAKAKQRIKELKEEEKRIRGEE